MIVYDFTFKDYLDQEFKKENGVLFSDIINIYHDLLPYRGDIELLSLEDMDKVISEIFNHFHLEGVTEKDFLWILNLNNVAPRSILHDFLSPAKKLGYKPSYNPYYTSFEQIRGEVCWVLWNRIPDNNSFDFIVKEANLDPELMKKQVKAGFFKNRNLVKDLDNIKSKFEPGFSHFLSSQGSFDFYKMYQKFYRWIISWVEKNFDENINNSSSPTGKALLERLLVEFSTCQIDKSYIEELFWKTIRKGKYFELEQAINRLVNDDIFNTLLFLLKNKKIDESTDLVTLINSIEAYENASHISGLSLFKKDYELSVKSIINLNLNNDSHPSKVLYKAFMKAQYLNDILQKAFYINTKSGIYNKERETFLKTTAKEIIDFWESGKLLDKRVPNWREFLERIKKFIAELQMLVEIVTAPELRTAQPKRPELYLLDENIGDFKFSVLKSFDPYHTQVGIDTNCCQYLGGPSHTAVIDSFINPLAGVLILKKDDLLLSQSYFHYVRVSERGEGYILDNVEWNLNNIQKVGLNERKLTALYNSWAKRIQEKTGVKFIDVGGGYNKLVNTMLEPANATTDPRIFNVDDPYTDWNINNQYSLLKLKSYESESHESESHENEANLEGISIGIPSNLPHVKVNLEKYIISLPDFKYWYEDINEYEEYSNQFITNKFKISVYVNIYDTYFKVFPTHNPGNTRSFKSETAFIKFIKDFFEEDYYYDKYASTYGQILKLATLYCNPVI